MVNLIKDNRNKVLFIFLLICCSYNTLKKTDSIIHYDIIFGDYFSNDVMDFYIDNSLVVKNGYLDSKGSSGVTKIHLKITYENGKYFIDDGVEKKLFTLNKKVNFFKLIVNGVEKSFKVYPKNGKYIIFFDDETNGIQFFQSKKPLELD